MMRQERRRTQRIHPFVARCAVEIGKRRLIGYVIELSVQGARIALSESPPQIGATILVEIRFGRRGKHVRTKGVVQWLQQSDRDGGAVFGLAFSDLNHEDRKFIESVVGDFADRAARIG
jgi:hypothetical protein